MKTQQKRQQLRLKLKNSQTFFETLNPKCKKGKFISKSSIHENKTLANNLMEFSKFFNDRNRGTQSRILFFT